MAVTLEMDDVQLKRVIQSAGECMGYAKVMDEQFRVKMTRSVVGTRLPTGYGKSLALLRCSAMGT